MIICIIGSGGREHAICKTISLSSKASKIYCIPGNAGTKQLAENIDLDKMKKSITGSSKYTIFDFSNAFVSRNTSKAIQVLESLKVEGTAYTLII